MKRILISWSSGKDSAWTLHTLRQDPNIEIAGLLTTFSSEFNRVAMHAVRRSLVDQQADAAGLPLRAVPLPWPCPNDAYQSIMAEVCQSIRAEGIDAIAFGDLFLADIRAYRERQLAGTGLEPIFPLWQIPTDQLASEMIRSGLRARLTCVDLNHKNFAGRDFDERLLADLPKSTDPCGENGEFHSFVYDGPMFRRPIPIELGEIVERDGFVFADLQ